MKLYSLVFPLIAGPVILPPGCNNWTLICNRCQRLQSPLLPGVHGWSLYLCSLLLGKLFSLPKIQIACLRDYQSSPFHALTLVRYVLIFDSDLLPSDKCTAGYLCSSCLSSWGSWHLMQGAMVQRYIHSPYRSCLSVLLLPSWLAVYPTSLNQSPILPLSCTVPHIYRMGWMISAC